MLQKIKITNFKSFKDQQELTLAPITLIYGPNSSGKSSVIQSILLLNQTIKNRDSNMNSELSLNGMSLDLGLPRNIFHKGNCKKPISFSFEGDLASYTESKKSSKRTDPIKKFLDEYKRYQINIDCQQLDPDSPRSPLVLKRIEYQLFDEDTLLLSKFNFIRELTGGNQYILDGDASRKSVARIFSKFKGADEIGRVAFSNELGNLSEEKIIDYLQEIKFSNSSLFGSGFFPVEIDRGIDFIERRKYDKEFAPFAFLWHRFISDLNFSVERSLAECKNISGLRESPKRFYRQNNSGQYVGSSGENTASLLFDHKKRFGNLDQVNKGLKLLEVPYKIDVQPIDDGLAGALLVIRLTDIRNNVEVTPVDVGVGISQVLPILAQGVSDTQTNSFASRRLYVRCVEQPELHLHPKLQANLADFFIESATKNKKIRWIIETHSEALILRLQKRIRQKLLNKDWISVNYVNPVKGGKSELLNLRLDEDGDFIDEWPNGFFEESYKEKFFD